MLSAIWEGKLLSPRSREYAITVLKRQQLDAKIPAGLSPGTTVTHKTGELEGNVHDAENSVLSDGEFVIAVLTYGDNATGIATIRRATRLTHETFAEGP